MTQTQVSGSGIKNNVITNSHLHSAANIAGSKLADSGVTAGSYGSGSSTLSLTINAKGLITAASTNAITQVGGNNGVDFNDNVKARFGAGADLQIYHDGTQSFIKNATGNLDIITGSTSIDLQGNDGSETLAKFIPNGGVELYYDNVLKLSTGSHKVGVYGDVVSEPNVGNVDAGFRGYPEGNAVYTWFRGYSSDGVHNAGMITHSGQTLFLDSSNNQHIYVRGHGTGNIYFQTDSTNRMTIDGSDIYLPDDQVLKFGASSDLYIKHSSGHNANFIVSSSGDIEHHMASSKKIIKGFNNSGTPYVALYRDGNVHFRTESGGAAVVDVNSSVSLRLEGSGGTCGYLTGDGSTVIGISDNVGHYHVKGTKDGSTELYHDNSQRFLTESNGATLTGARLRIQNSGNTDFNIRDTSTNAVSAYIGAKTAGRVEYNCYKEGVGTKYPHVFVGYTEEYARIDSAGIKFNGDTASANALDDYEEGTFTPKLRTIGSSQGEQTGVGGYTKIGNVVHVYFQFDNKNATGLQDNNYIYVTNLPFTCNSQRTRSTSPQTYNVNGDASSQVYFMTDPNTSSLIGFRTRWNTTWTYWESGNFRGGNIYVRADIRYFTDS